ncbi:hypothetical protein FisN_4Lu595 [Fistulifera solaris]|uniref:THIF-type NAD/FAD binding fold domain-containing protein n=1 Tax=Fistulifera solaris TaxID=1519565 RepID=A0A1Z5KDE5_FISSO|nr:hypothetical protein FisN_4Lu595 [Fistulifera solaris]|eukprot:GAX24289.1 hypothetical protein FisN_4Lu595 [Fistulifera solaris]
MRIGVGVLAVKRRRREWSFYRCFVVFATSILLGIPRQSDSLQGQCQTIRRRPLKLYDSTQLEIAIPDEVDSRQEEYRLRFGGVGRLYEGKSSDSSRPLQRLQQATVAIVGLGGVGSWAAEALCRSGIGNLVLIDLDDICISNTNRQLHATSSTIGRLKIEEMQKKLFDINPHCNVSLVHEFVSPENVHEVIGNLGATVLLDMIDGSREKSALLAACADLKLPVVTCGGAAGRRDPTKIICGDLTEVEGDKLLATCRKELRKYHGFERGLSFQEKRKNHRKSRKWSIAAVFSTEPQKSLPAGTDLGSSFRRCDGALGTACFVTGAYGFAAAARVVDMIAEGRTKPPQR